MKPVLLMGYIYAAQQITKETLTIPIDVRYVDSNHEQ